MPILNNPGLRVVSRLSHSNYGDPQRTVITALDPLAQAIIAGVGLDFLVRNGPAYIADGEGHVLWGNVAWHEFVATCILSAGYDPSFIPWPSGQLKDSFADEISINRKDMLPSPDGRELTESQHWAAWQVDGTLIGFAGIIIGASAEDRLRRQYTSLHERYEDLTRLVSDGIWETDNTLQFVAVTPRIGELAGYHPREMVGHSLQEFGDFVDAAGHIVSSPLDEEKPQPFRDRAFILRDAAGMTRHFRIAGLPVFSETGRFKGFRGTARDVTGEALALGLVAQSRSQLTQAIESISDGFALYDSSERLLLWNQRYLGTMPKTASVIHVGMRFQELMRIAYARGDFRVDSTEEQLLSLDLANRARKQISIEYELADGRWIRATDRFTSDGSIVGVRTDITESKRREHALIRSRDAAEYANRAKSEFLANVSHELRTPLNAIIGFSELILSEVMGAVGNPQYRTYLEDILTSGRRLLDVINDILDLARAEAGNLELNSEIIDVTEVIESVVRPLRERALKSNIRLTSIVDVNLPSVEADPRKLRQMLFNLVGNAIKFTLAGGVVNVTAGRGERGELVIRVVDTGIGMSSADIETAFRPFGQVDGSLGRKFEGTGLGLPLTRAIAELHGGTLSIESSLGAGTVVAVRLPASRLRFIS